MYYIIDTLMDEMYYRHTAEEVSIFMLGRSIDRYLIVKNDKEANLYRANSGDITQIQKDLEAL